MTNEEKIHFEEFLLESFENDITFRELRLSEEEKEYLHLFFPHAKVKILSDEICTDGKIWYEVCIK